MFMAQRVVVAPAIATNRPANGLRVPVDARLRP